MKTRLVNMFFLLLLAIFNPSFANVYVVNQKHPSANDEGPGTRLKPYKTITRALNKLLPGDTVFISTGIYRETPVLTQNGASGKPIVIMAEPGSEPIIRGSDIIASWEQERQGVYSSPWMLKSLVSKDREEQLGFAVYGEQVFVNDQLLKHVRLSEELVENTFYIDRDKKKIVICLQLHTKPENAIIEVSTRTNWFDIRADYIVVSGLKMERAFATVQRGGFLIRGNNWLVENNEFSYSGGGRGATFSGTDGIVRNNNIHHNGQMGFSLVGKRILFELNKVHHNNTNRYPSWEQGGSKVANSVECIFRKNSFYDELYGPGLWLDIDNYRNIIEQNTFDSIGFAAIMIEISYDNIIRNNIIRNTRYYLQCGSGILVQLSSKTKIYNNLIINSEQCGIHLRWHIRTRDFNAEAYSPTDPDAFLREKGFSQSDWMGPTDQYPENDNDIRNNIIINDENAAVAIIPTLHPVYFKNNQSDYNFFGHTAHQHPMEGSQRLVEWQAYTGFDLHSIMPSTEPGSLKLEELFLNPSENDFRLKHGSPLIGKGTLIKDVPDDFQGNQRSPDNQMDIGPYVFNLNDK
jgi:parallel beta-helix repeat protein